MKIIAIMKIILLLYCVFGIVLHGEELRAVDKSISDFYFCKKILDEYYKKSMNDIKMDFKSLYSDNEKIVFNLKSDADHFPLLADQTVKCVVANVSPRSNFDVKLLEGMPLEVLDLTFFPPKKLSDLRFILRPGLKELYLQNVIIDDASLLNALELEALGLKNIVVMDKSIIERISAMKSLKLLSVGTFYAKKDDSDFFLPIKNISFSSLAELSLLALDLRFSAPANLDFLKNQEHLDFLILSTNLSVEYEIPHITGKKFYFLNIPTENTVKTEALLKQYQVSSKILVLDDISLQKEPEVIVAD